MSFFIQQILMMFQFHKGTIKTLAILLIVLAYLMFQFHKGTIKTKAGVKFIHDKVNVSIP